MMSQCSAELCMLLIEDNFGELFARIFTVLQRYERLTLPRLKFYARLTDRQLHHGLSAMIQHHLIYHFTSLDDGNTYYEANPQAAYSLVRSGKILQLVENRLGEYAAQVLEAIMMLGHSSIAHLETLPELKSKRQRIPNGTGHDEIKPEQDEENEEDSAAPNGDHVVSEKPVRLHPTLKSLASHGYIHRLREAHFQSPNDNWLDASRIIASRPDVKLMKGKQQAAEIEEKAKDMVKERTEGDLTRGLIYNGVPQGAKRKRDHGNSESNKQAPNGTNGVNGHHVGDEEEEDNDWSEDEDGVDSMPMDSNLIVRVNYEKLDVALRNTRFLELAEQDAPSASVEIYDCLLRRIEYQTARCRDSYEIPREGEEGEQYSAPIQLSSIVEDVDPHLDLTGCIGPMEPSTVLNKRGKRPLDDDTNGVNGDEHEDEPSEQNRAYEIDQHLGILSQPPLNLTTKHVISGLPTWRVAFRGLSRKLRHLELERMIESRYGDVALRVVRVLHSKGKLDEKRLQEISLLPFKDLRQTLASMQTGGFVDLQEVPRDAQRQPSKTIYLWYYDPDRVCSSILEDTYKAMSRCLQRIKFERTRERDFLEKTERTDVKGHEEEFLSEAELEHLRNWKAKEALLLAEVSRLDDMVAVFRDY